MVETGSILGLLEQKGEATETEGDEEGGGGGGEEEEEEEGASMRAETEARVWRRSGKEEENWR